MSIERKKLEDLEKIVKLFFPKCEGNIIIAVAIPAEEQENAMELGMVLGGSDSFKGTVCKQIAEECSLAHIVEIPLNDTSKNPN